MHSGQSIWTVVFFFVCVSLSYTIQAKCRFIFRFPSDSVHRKVNCRACAQGAAKGSSLYKSESKQFMSFCSCGNVSEEKEKEKWNSSVHSFMMYGGAPHNNNNNKKKTSRQDWVVVPVCSLCSSLSFVSPLLVLYLIKQHAQFHAATLARELWNGIGLCSVSANTGWGCWQ